MTQVLMVVDTDVCAEFDLRDDAEDVCAALADVAEPLIEGLQLVYSPATVAVILDYAAKAASYAAAAEAPNRECALQLQGIIHEQRELIRAAGRDVEPRPLTAELLW